MEAAVVGVLILCLASGTHVESPHGGLRSIVGDILDDGETRAAVGAVGEGVSVAAIVGIEEFSLTILTSSNIWGDEEVPPRLRLTGTDLEPIVTAGLDFSGGEGFDTG